jgi:hypothetical protein
VRVFYGRGAYLRNNGNLPRLRLINLYVEQSPTDEEGVILLSRKGLSEYASVGTGPITGAFQEPGVFGGDVFCVSGGHLFRGASDLGAIDGTGPVSFAGTTGELLVSAGASLWSYNGTNLVAVSFPDSANVTAITFHDGLFIAARAGGHKYYWSAVLDGRTWNPLDFASAESKPDALLDLRVVNDTLWLFGEETIEPWANTGDADVPYQRFEQRIFSKGVKATGCVVEMDQALFFVAHDSMAYALRDGPERISDHGIEEQIAASASVSCFGYIDEGHSFFCIRLETQTFAYDVATGQWAELQTYGRTNFRAQCATAPGDAAIFGDDEAGTLWTLDGYKDGADALERLFTIALPMNGGTLAVDTVAIWANVGWTELIAGQGSDPVAELRLSRDAGATFGDWRQARLGEQGEYRTRTVWRRCGLFDAPGMLGEIRISDPVGFRLSSVTANEPGGGRGR